MKASASQLRAAIDRSDPAIRLYLLYGPDDAGAREWVTRLGRRLGAAVERVDLDGAQLRGDPARLATEAASMSLFGAPRYVLVSNAGEESGEAITLLFAAEQIANPVVLIAPSAKATSKLVKAALASPMAMAHACYQPVGEEANTLASTIAAEHGLRATGRVAARLVGLSGGDRAVLTREIEKLALYLDAAPDRPKPLDDEAIDAVGADLGEGDIAAAIDAAVEGRPDALGDALARLSDAGTSPIPVLRATVRRLMLLADLSADIAAGASITDAIDRHNIFFREKASIAKALRLWSPRRLSDAINHLRRAERSLMAANTAGPVLAEAAMVDVARAARRG